MNVIVVVCNSLHLGFLGAYGNPWIETPNLDRLAAEGVVFDHHFPENLTTLPTRRSWWTGRYGFADPTRAGRRFGPDEAILPDLLWDKGVRTALISDVPFLREVGMGYGRGFDEVDLGTRSGIRSARAAGRSPGPRRATRGRAGPAPAADDDDETRRSGRPDGSNSCATGRCSGRSRRGEHRRRRTVQNRDRLARASRRANPIRSCCGWTCSARMGRGIRLSRTVTSTSRSSPTSSRPARKAI